MVRSVSLSFSDPLNKILHNLTHLSCTQVDDPFYFCIWLSSWDASALEKCLLTATQKCAAEQDLLLTYLLVIVTLRSSLRLSYAMHLHVMSILPVQHGSQQCLKAQGKNMCMCMFEYHGCPIVRYLCNASKLSLSSFCNCILHLLCKFDVLLFSWIESLRSN